MSTIDGVARRVRDDAISRISGLADHRVVAVAAAWGIRAETWARQSTDLTPELVRQVWGLVSRQEHDSLTERVSALEDRVRQIESRDRGATR